ncbi:hypothetical protein BH23THE1_BH23THE1_34710 [soil metagenome]
MAERCEMTMSDAYRDIFSDEDIKSDPIIGVYISSIIGKDIPSISESIDNFYQIVASDDYEAIPYDTYCRFFKMKSFMQCKRFASPNLLVLDNKVNAVKDIVYIMWAYFRTTDKESIEKFPSNDGQRKIIEEYGKESVDRIISSLPTLYNEVSLQFRRMINDPADVASVCFITHDTIITILKVKSSGKFVKLSDTMNEELKDILNRFLANLGFKYDKGLMSVGYYSE